MVSDQSRPANPSSDAQGRVRHLLDAASNLALFGAEPLGRELCASIFLGHTPLLVADPEAKRRFVACLLLLNMNQLLGRALRALDGVDLSCTTVFADGAERKIFSFSNGISLAIPVLEPGADRTTRDRFAATWSQRILEAAALPAEAWVAPEPTTPTPVGRKSEAHSATAAITALDVVA